ncbi:thymus-specific serine protease-like [Petromyzon marinus]|uniref:thymus-specific serine protease-like n=1 Tax=Petromyzon marinus TaxID=7757 RepID=UPI003F7154BD
MKVSGLLFVVLLLVLSESTQRGEASLTEGTHYVRELKQRLLYNRQSRLPEDLSLRGITPGMDSDGLPQIPPQFMEQPLDHFDKNNNRTIQQRFWVDRRYWEGPGGPVFLFIGGEVPLSKYNVLVGSHVELAERMGAMVVAAEHRFYGQSTLPEGATDSALPFLRVPQALADLVGLIRTLSRDLDLPEETRWVAFGGSYSGALAAWLREKFPSLIFAAIASSAPVRAKVDFHEFNEAVGRSLANPIVGGSKECLRRVSEAFATIDKMVQSGRLSELSHDFSSCVPLAAENPRDVDTFVTNLAAVFIMATTFNAEAHDASVADVCTTMTDDSLGNSYTRLTHINKRYLIKRIPCTVNLYQGVISELRDPQRSELRPWFYQKCTELGFLQTCRPREGCPFSKLLSLETTAAMCADAFGLTQQDMERGVESTNRMFGGDRPTGSRLLFVNGDVDPWRELSVVTPFRGSAVKTLTVRGGAHCSDTNPSLSRDPPALTQARKAIGQQLEAWLRMSRDL